MVKETEMKQTEIGLIPQDWEVRKLGESFEFKNGLNKEKEFFGYGFPIVNYMDVYRNTFISSQNFSGKVFVSSQELKSFEARKGDVLFTRTSETPEEIGYSAVVLDDLKNTVFSGFVLRARPFNNKFDLQFCRYCFSNSQVREQIIANATYTTRALTNGRVLSEIQIPLPPLAEQEAIAAALSDCDAWIESLEAVIAKKRLIKHGAMQELLTPKEDWEVKTIKEITNNIIDYRGVTPKKLGMDWGDGNIVALSAGNVKKGFIDFNSECYFASEELYKRWMRNGNPKKDDIVFTLEAPLGNVALLPNNEKYILSQRTILLQLTGNFYSKFIFQQLLSSRFQNYILESATGSTAQGLKRQVFEKLFISVPKSLSEQTHIATVLSDMDAELEALVQKLNKARQIKQGMMQELLTGRVRLV